MAKTIRLQGDIQGHAGQALTYTIHSDLGTGLTSPEDVRATLADGLSFDWDSGDINELYSPFMSSTCSLEFILDHDDEIDAFVEMVRGSESDTYIVVEQDNGWRWIGSLLPDEASVEITDGYTSVQMVFTDGLSLLKGMDFRSSSDDVFQRSDESDGGPYQAGRTTLGLVWTILNKIPWMQEVSWPAGTNVITEVPGIGADPNTLSFAYKPNLPHTAMNPAAFSKEAKNRRRGRSMPKPKSFVNCYDVLGDICETFGYRLSWNGEGWSFLSPFVMDDYATGGLGYSYLHSDLVSDGGGRMNGALAIQLWGYDLDVSYAMGSGATRTFGQKFSGARGVHSEAGSNQLWTRRDNVVIGSSSNFRDLVDGTMKQAEPLVEFDAESDISIRYQGYFDLKGGLDAKNASGHKPCAVVKLTLGTTSDAADPYLLSSDLLIQGYDTTINGAASASDMRCWANASLPSAEWVNESAVQTKSDGLPDPYDKPGLLYIPLTWGGDNFSPSAPSVDHGEDGTFYGGLHTRQESGESNVLRYDKWGQLHFDVTLPTISTPNSALEGYSIEVGLAFFGASDSSIPEWSGESVEVLNTVTARDTSTFVHTLESATDSLYNYYVENFVLHKIRLNKGDGTSSADRIYFEEVDNGAVDSFEFAEVRVASGLQDGSSAQGPKFINVHDATWPTESWSYDADWRSYSGVPSANPTTKENLELLADEWLFLNADGAEGLSAEFVPTYEASSPMPTGANLFNTSCTTAGNTDTAYLPTRFSWKSTSGLDFEGAVIVRDTLLTPFRSAEDPEELPDFAKPFLKEANDGLGGTSNSIAKSIGEVLGASTLSDTLTLSSVLEVHGAQGNRGIGGPEQYKLNQNLTQSGTEVTANLHFVGGVDDSNVNTSASVLKLGLSDFDTSREPVGSWNTADGGLTMHAWLDTSTASNADVLSYNSGSGQVEWAAQTGGGGGGATNLNGLSDVTLTGSATGDMLVNIAGTFVNSTAADVATTLAGNMDLEDISDVNASTATTGDLLSYDGTNWVPTPRVPFVSYDEDRYNNISTTEGLRYWLPGNGNTGANATTGTDTTSLSGANFWNRYKKMSHRVTPGTYDIDVNVDISMSSNSSGSSSSTSWTGEDVDVRLYKVSRTSASNTCSFSLLDSQIVTFNATSSTTPNVVTFNLTASTWSSTDRALILVKGEHSGTPTATAYCHWSYDMQCYKTA